MSEWISVKDRLPDNWQHVLVRISGRRTALLEYKDNGWNWVMPHGKKIEGSWTMPIPTHWMPLPKPPREGE